MKKSLLLSAMGLIGFSASAQTFVSTSPENRNAVLEEYTGIYCGFCPDGHAIAQDLYDDNPGDVMLVNVHVGGFANPNPGDPDFRTQFGVALDNAAGVCGYPAGSVNRQEFPGLEQTDNNGNPCGATTAMGRGNWANAAGQVIDDPSPVNVAAQATLNLDTRELEVSAEVYYTASSANDPNYLTVAVLQNNVVGPQSGSSANPDQVNPDGSYNHNHMLRHFITGQWGAPILDVGQGDFFSDTYSWTVPTNINGVPVELSDLEVVVYVSEGEAGGEITTGSKSSLDFQASAVNNSWLRGLDVPGTVCGGELAPKVQIMNYGSADLTSLEIDYDINGATDNYTWSGNLSTGSSEWITLPALAFSAQGATNILTVTTSSPNGATDEDTSNDSETATFSTEVAAAGPNIEVTINTDNYGSETTWEIQDGSGSVVLSGGPYTNVSGGETFVESTTGLADGCYSFIIDDDFGDGICCDYGQGSYQIRSGLLVLEAGGEFGSSEVKLFEVDQSLLGVDDLELVSDVAVYPNPVMDNARVTFSLAENGVVALDVINVLGATVVSENLGQRAAGNHTVDLNAERLESGIYMVNLTVGNQIHSTRISVSK